MATVEQLTENQAKIIAKQVGASDDSQVIAWTTRLLKDSAAWLKRPTRARH